MSKHLQNLERLSQKMQERYGDGDDLVLELKQELSAMERKKAKDYAAKNLGRRKLDQPMQAPSVH